MIFGRSSNIPELQSQCQLTFKMTTKERLTDLIKGMRGRLDAVILAEGDATPY